MNCIREITHELVRDIARDGYVSSIVKNNTSNLQYII